MELEAESKAHRTWTPVLQVPEETVAIATFQWRRVPLTRPVILRLLAIAAAIVIGCGVFAYGVSAAGAKTFGSRSEILYPISAEIASGGFLRTDRTLQTQLETIKSRTVLQPVASKYHMTVDELSKQVVATVLLDSEVIRIEVDNGSQAQAQKMVADVARKYLGIAALDTNAKVEKNLNQQIGNLQTQRDGLTRTLSAAASNSPEALQIQAELTGINNQIESLQSQLSTAQVQDLQTPKVQQLTQPYEVGKVGPKSLRAGIAGALAGMMIAAGVVVLLIRRRLKKLPLDQFG